MKISLLGGGELLIKLAKELANNKKVDQVNIITSPRRAKEKMTLDFSFKEKCLKLKNKYSQERILYNELKSLDDPIGSLLLKDCDLGISFGAAWIFKRKHIESCKNLYNFHPTNLPQWRGGGGSSWRILSGINYGAISLHKIAEGIDTGNIVFTKKYFFPPECKTPREHDQYTFKLSFEILNEFIKDFVLTDKTIKTFPQQESFSSYFPRLNASVHACIDWSWNPGDLVKFIQAFDDPYTGAFTRVSGTGKKVFLKGAIILQGECNYHPYQAGIIYRKDDSGIYICANGGSILVKYLLDESNENFMLNISLGDRLYTSLEDLELSLSTKVIYNASEQKINYTDSN